MNERRAELIAGDRIKITFPFDQADVARVRTLPGRKFHGKDNPKHWTCIANARAIVQLREWGFHIDDDLLAIWADQTEQDYEAEERAAAIEAGGARSIPGFKGELLPFQPAGVAFIERKKGRALLADEQGLGKTIQTFGYMCLHPETRPVVAVVPATAKYDWEAKAHQFLENPDCEVLSGKTPYPITSTFVIINYDILPDWLDVILELDPKLIVLDEPQYIKNNSAQRTVACKKLAKGRQLIGLSGTPGDMPLEVQNIINMIDPSVFPNPWSYKMRYCGAKHNGFGWDFQGAEHVEELHQILTDTIMLRRKKKDVLPDLPDKMYSLVPLELSAKGRKQYEKVYKEFVAKYQAGIAAMRKQMMVEGATSQQIRKRIKGMMGAKGMVELEGLKLASAEAKLDSSIEWIRDRLASGDKLVVFAMHKSIVDAVYEAFKDVAVKVDGSVTGKKRWNAVLRFQEDDACRLFVGNMKACAVNLTLTAASHIAMLELPPRPSWLMQAEDRCHRIGQKNAVNVYYLLGYGTIDRSNAAMLDGHRKVLDMMMDGKETEDDELIGEMFEEILGMSEAA